MRLTTLCIERRGICDPMGGNFLAEGESATFGLLSLANASIAKFVVQMYPLLYPQMIGLCGSLTVKNQWVNLIGEDVVYFKEFITVKLHSHSIFNDL